MFTRYRIYVAILLAPLLLFAGSEIVLRIAGFGSFPIYDVDKDLKYIPSANQSGAFLERHRWDFNDRLMGNAIDWSPGRHPDVLLIGNSIVMGGLPFDRDQKLGALLQQALHGSYAVWSVAAPGWTNVNEMTYLDKNVDVLKDSDVVVFEYMEGGLSGANPWAGDILWPRRKPLSVTVYTLEKYVIPRLTGVAPVDDMGALPPNGPPDPAQLDRFKRMVADAAKAKRVLIFLYPTEQNLTDKAHWGDVTAPIVAICESLSVTCVDIAKQENWRADLYKGGTHVGVEGAKVLANILAENILKLNANKSM